MSKPPVIPIGMPAYILPDLPDLWYYWTRRPWVQRETH